jgi:glycosyltransferase involved in cell wall biosynthesis
MYVVNLGTYPPKLCGIATFSKDLRDNLDRTGVGVRIAAVSDTEYTYDYPAEVACEIRQEIRQDYAKAARQINRSAEADLVIIQHEYGIFGGADGAYVLDFTNSLEKPYMMVAHTILPNPTRNQKEILNHVAEKAAVVICMTKRSARLLEDVYDVPPEKIRIVYHGVPVFQAKDREQLKQRYGYAGRQIITTFGLIGPGKGLEIGIRALQDVVARHPDVLYLIAGKTHPMLLRREGERYREMLNGLISDLNLGDHVKFINHFMEHEELGDYLYMTDIYLSPYPNRDQAVSGTLAFAIGCGRAIVSTPYEYALAMLAEEQRGLIAADATPENIAILLDRVLSNPVLKAHLERKTARLGKTTSWPYVAGQYANLATRIVSKFHIMTEVGSTGPTRVSSLEVRASNIERTSVSARGGMQL